MFKAYDRLHEAWKRLIALAHILWWAWIINQFLKTANLDIWTILIYLLGPPVATLFVLNIIYWFVDRRKNPNG